MRIRSETIGDHWKNRRIHAFDFERRAGWQTRQDFIHLRLALEHGRDHVFAPLEIDRDFRRTATRCRSYTSHAGNCAHRFLDWRRNLHRHPLGRAIARVERNADAWKTDLRKERYRQGKTCDSAGERKRGEQKENGTRMAVRPRTKAHFLISTAMASSNS